MKTHRLWTTTLCGFLTVLLLSPALTPTARSATGVDRAGADSVRYGSPPSAPLPRAAAADEIAPDSTVELPPGVGTDWWAAVQEDIRRREYHITWQEHTYLADLEAAYQAPNRAHNLRTYFTPQGVRLIPRVLDGATPPWEWGLTLIGHGYADAVQPVGSPGSITVSDNRIEYCYRPSHITEWYVNDERGLEQGFTLAAPPASGEGELTLELVISGDLMPHLRDDGRTIEFTTPGGVTVLRYSDLLVTDAAGRQLPARLSLFGGEEGRGAMGIRIAFSATSAVYPITVDPLLTTPAWSAEGNQADAWFGYSVGTAGDVNGDGYSDVIVGAPYYANGESNEGAAFVYYGSASGLATSYAWTAEGNQENAYFGYSVGTAGDVNGDGYSDVIVGADGYDGDQTDEGAAYVYHGSAYGLGASPAWSAEGNKDYAHFGSSVGTAGDVNGDGYSDVIVGAYSYTNDQSNEGAAFVYHGSASGLATSYAWSAEGNQEDAYFGQSAGTAGDVNGDGYADVIVGAYSYTNDQTDEGAAYVYHGSASGLATSPAWSAEGNQSYAYFGRSVGTAGDVNGDGYSDVIVGADGYDGDQTGEGAAYVYHGSASGLATSPAWSAEGNQNFARFGRSVGTAGDVNGDGYADVIVGASRYDNGETDEGAAFVYHGSASGLGSSPAWSAESDQGNAYFGYSVGVAGDVNGDGYSDVIVGAYSYTNDQIDEGAAFVYHGSASGLATSPAWSAESDQAEARLGCSVGVAGDVNGDGYSDIIVGAHYYDNGGTDAGAAFVYHGSASGLGSSPAWSAESDQGNAYFGYSVGTAGDVNGDGYSDVIVGAPYYANGPSNEGAAFVYYGSASGLANSPDWSAEGNQENAYFGYSVGTAGDVNGDGYSDVIVGANGYTHSQDGEGAAFVYHGSASGLAPSPAWTAGGGRESARFGCSVGTAGDVNGDGYSDVIVGADYYTNDLSNEGAAFVYHGSASGLATSPAWSAEGDQANAYFGCSVGTAGDVNGDGYSDVIVGASWYDNGEYNEGRAYVYHGSASGLGATPAWSAEGDQALANFGNSVGTAGDVNGDGYSDVIVGAVYYDNGQTNEGAAYVYHGSASGLESSPAWSAEGNQDYAWFGYSVGTAGDVNGDGYADVVVGASRYDSGETDEGAAFVYYGNGGDGLHLRPRQLRTDGSTPIAYLGMADSCTTFQVGLIGRMPLGREKVRLQWQAAPLGTPFTDPGVIEGTSHWVDTLTAGATIIQTVGGLTPGTPYHWRVRLLYRPGNRLGQPASRWIHIPWAGWNETDLRTESYCMIYLPLVLRRSP